MSETELFKPGDECYHLVGFPNDVDDCTVLEDNGGPTVKIRFQVWGRGPFHEEAAPSPPRAAPYAVPRTSTCTKLVDAAGKDNVAASVPYLNPCGKINRRVKACSVSVTVPLSRGEGNGHREKWFGANPLPPLRDKAE